jgi:hypothetical protein
MPVPRLRFGLVYSEPRPLAEIVYSWYPAGFGRPVGQAASLTTGPHATSGGRTVKLAA